MPRRSSAGFDPRSAIFRAREAYRERARARAVAARQAAGAEAASGLRGEENQEASVAIATGERVDRLSGNDHDQPGPLAIDSGPAEHEPESAEMLPVPVDAATESISQVAEAEAAAPELTPAPESGQAFIETASALGDNGWAEWTSETLTPRQESAHQVPLPDWFNVDMPRICRACRDFRPSAEGERGWCGNTWAFTTRRLVQAHDVAPCQSAIGDWWVPVDDVWLVAADVSAHGRPTPLLDRFLGTERKQRRRS